LFLNIIHRPKVIDLIRYSLIVPPVRGYIMRLAIASPLENDGLVHCTRGWTRVEACRELKPIIPPVTHRVLPLRNNLSFVQSGTQQNTWACLFQATTYAPFC
jgi:hypothetical protein